MQLDRKPPVVHVVTAAVLAAGVASAPASGGTNLLSNPNFEIPGGSDVFLDWTDFGGNIVAELTDPLEGVASAKMFGQFAGPGQNDTVMIQSVPVTGGNLHEFSILSEQRSDDPLDPLAFCLVAFQYQDASNVVLQETIVFIGDNRDGVPYPPLDTPTVTTIQAPAPPAATQAVVLPVFVQIDDAPGSIFFDQASLTDEGPFNFDDPWNLSFEHGLVGQTPPGWFTTGTNASQNGDAPTDGERALIQFGNFPGDGSLNDTITRSTTFDVQPGDQVEVSAWAQHLSTDPIAPDNLAFLNVEYYDSIGQVVGFEGMDALTSADPTDTPVQATVQSTAPAGAVEAAIALGYQQVNEGPGAVHWDDVSFTVSPGGCDGDANGDGAVDSGDISFIIFRLGDSGAACLDGDANGDGIVNSADISYVIFRLGTCDPGGPC